MSKQQSIQEVAWVLLKAFSFIREAEHVSSENLQPDITIEKKNPFSEGKCKPAAEICISNKEPKVNHQDNGENVSRACQRPLWQPLPSQTWRFRRKNWFHGSVPGSLYCVQSRDLVPCFPAAPAVTKRGQGISQAVTSEGVSPKPWQLLCGVEPASAQKSGIGVWEPLPRFQRMYGSAWMPKQKFATGVGPAWRTFARAVWKGNVRLEPPRRIPAGAPPSGAMRRGPLSFRPQKGRSTGSLHCAPGKTANIQCQPVKAARREAVPCKATGAELPKTMGTHLLHQCDLYVRHGVRGDNFRALRFDGPARF
nr:uncharacterized protein LOC129049989 [Pongo abelii]